MRTEQENFWEGSFGDEYTQRNSNHNQINNFSKIFLENRLSIKSAIEIGSNLGKNLDALKLLFPECKTFGIEINKSAYQTLSKNHDGFNGSIYDFSTDMQYELSISYGVLIHQPQEKLKDYYRKLYDFSNKYILITEYFSPYPVTVKYRDYDNKLFKRDFAKEFWNTFNDLKLIDYGFFWSQDDFTNGDDTNWFLFKK